MVAANPFGSWRSRKWRGPVFGLLLAGTAGIGLVIGDGLGATSGPVDSTEYASKRIGADLVAFCPDDGSYSLHGYESPDNQPEDADESAPLAESPDRVVEEFIKPIAAGASPDNPMLNQLDQADRERQIEWLTKYFEPARTLAMNRASVQQGGDIVYEVVTPDGFSTRDDPPSGADRWSLGFAAVGQTDDGDFYLAEALLCSDALTTRAGQIAIQEFNDDLYQDLTGTTNK